MSLRVLTVGRETKLQLLAREVAGEIFATDNLAEAFDIVERSNPDLILFDYLLGSVGLNRFVNAINKNPNVYVIVVGEDKNSKETSDEFIKNGAHDFLNGKSDYPRLTNIADQIKNFKTSTTDSGQADFFADDFSASIGMVGRSKATLETLKMIKLVAASQCNPVLIVGQTGTGKELAAKAIHEIRNQGEPFVAVNCAALTANLLESELFGHVKGSFTSADYEKTGLLSLAGTGTIFFDEISEIPVELQAKLLRVIQEKTFRKVGGVKDIRCKATIITSSNRSLKDEVQAKRFRQDLYYRLNICPIIITPLKAPKRKNDVPLLAEYFLKTSKIFPQKTNKIKSITKLSIESLMRYDWPGNVRELQNVIERAILLESTDKISLNSIVIDPPEFSQLSDDPNANTTNDFSLEKAECELIARALRETNWQKTKAANLLGISRATLYAKVKQHNIENNSVIAINSSKKPLHEISMPNLLKPAPAAP